MNITREVILDLLPLYLSGEASADTRTLVEVYMRTDPELARYVRSPGAEHLPQPAQSAVEPDSEMRALRRTLRLLTLQRWLFGLGIALSALAINFWILDAGIYPLRTRHPLPLLLVGSGSFTLVPGIACLLAYCALRRWLPGTRWLSRSVRS